MNRYVVGFALSVLLLFSVLMINPFGSLVGVEATSSSIEDETVVYIDPLTLYAALGSTFTINISIANVVNLFSYEFRIYYDNTLLDGIQVKLPEGHFLEPTGLGYIFNVVLEIKNDFNSTHGRVFVAATLLSPEPGKTGSGVIATITFRAINVGNCIFDICETIFVSKEQLQIAHEVQDGYFESETAEHEIAVFLEVPSHLIPGESTDINVAVQNGGQNNENNVILQLLIDETKIDSMEISFLPVGSSHTLIYRWTPLDEARHNVTAFAPSLAGEVKTMNNLQSLEVVVSYVINVPLHFLTIQEAINAASSGDTIRVMSGTYYERLIIDRSVTLVGENRNTTIIDGGKHFRVIEILRPGQGSRISGFTIQRGVAGIYIESDDNIIEDNTIVDCEVGIHLFQPSGNIIRRNTMENNEVGIECDERSSDNVIYHNNFIDNIDQAIDTGDNIWDYGDEGNYWSDYNGTDTNEDNIGDSSYGVNSTLGTWDNAPLFFVYVFLSGDLNGDGEVDLLDLVVAATSAGSYPRHPRWNPAADINSDGKVNIIDMVLIARNF